MPPNSATVRAIRFSMSAFFETSAAMIHCGIANFFGQIFEVSPGGVRRAPGVRPRGPSPERRRGRYQCRPGHNDDFSLQT